MQHRIPKFDRRSVKVIGLSADTTTDHQRWAAAIAETQGAAPSYPVIVGAGFRVAKLYQMLPVSVSGDPGARTPADNQTMRNLAVPDNKVKLVLAYPMTTGRNLDEVPLVIDSRQLTARHRVAAPVNRQQGQDVLIAGSVCDEQDRDLYPDG